MENNEEIVMSETWHTLFRIEIDFLRPETLGYAQDLHYRCQEIIDKGLRAGNTAIDRAAQHILADDTEYPNQIEIDGGVLILDMDSEAMSGNIDQAAVFVQELLRFENTRKWAAIEWASVCEPFRPGGFSGGAAFVTRDDIRWLDSQRWITGAIRKHRDETMPVLRPPQDRRNQF
jgi:hypothetical protein